MTPADHATPPAEPTSAPPAANGPPLPDLLAEPTFEECQAEWIRFYDELKAGKFNDYEVPEGHFFAYYAGKIHDHDADPIALQNRVAAALGMHPARLVIRYSGIW